MDTEPEEVETEEEVIETPTLTGEQLADAEVEDTVQDDDSDDDEESEKPSELIKGEPLIEGKFTINIGLVIHPDDGHKHGQLVTISASSHGRTTPVLISKRMIDIGPMPAWLADTIAKVNVNLESLRQEAEEKKRKAAEEKEKAKKAAAAAKAKKDAPRLAKLAKKAAAKAKADKQKADARAKKEQAAAKAKAAKEKAAAKLKADKEKAELKAKADKTKADQQKAQKQTKPAEEPVKAHDLKPGEVFQPDLFSLLPTKGKKK